MCVVKRDIQDVTQPVNVGSADRVGCEEVVGHELDAVLGEGFGVFFRPDAVLSLCYCRGTILNDEVELGVDLGELKRETA